MLTLSNVPNEVFLVALDLMGQRRPDDAADARAALESAESRVDHEQIEATQGRDRTPLTAFAAALGMYVSLSGPFAEDGGEFSGLSGYHVAQPHQNGAFDAQRIQNNQNQDLSPIAVSAETADWLHTQAALREVSPETFAATILESAIGNVRRRTVRVSRQSN